MSTLRKLVDRIWDGATVAVAGAGGGNLEPTEIIHALVERYQETGHPRNLTIVHSSGLGDGNPGSGLSPLVEGQLVKRFIGGHFGLSPELAKAVSESQVEAYNLPQGVISQLFREQAADRPGLITRTGMGTFLDPEVGSTGLNDISLDKMVERLSIQDADYLFYPTLEVDFAFIKASTVNVQGGVTFKEEPFKIDAVEMASAVTARAKRLGNGGGALIQVKDSVAEESSHHVHIPSALVLDVVVVPDQKVNYVYNDKPEYVTPIQSEESPEMSNSGYVLQREIIAQRAADEVTPGQILNMGVGIPDRVAGILRERAIPDVHTTVEHGVFGGVSETGAIFGAARHPDAVMQMPNMIDLYQGGILDVAFLGFAQVDAQGNVNVSRYGSKVSGIGGFIDISQHAKKVVFCGTFNTGGLKVSGSEQQIHIEQEGKIPKFVSQVEEICFSAAVAIERGQEVLYITERAVFELTPQGLRLLEVLDGVDIHKEILDITDVHFDTSQVAQKVHQLN